MRTLRLFALFSLGFLSVALAVRHVLPWPVEYGLRAKWEHYARHHDRYDAVVLGTSRVFRGVDTPLLEQELGSAGVELSIFNFGVAGMRAFEQDYVLRRILELEPERLRYVFYEGGTWSPRFKHPALTYSSRSVFWHTPGQTVKVLDALSRSDLGWRETLRLAGTHIDLMLWRLANYGAGKRLLDRVLETETQASKYADTLAFLGQQAGYQSADQHTGRSIMQGREELLVAGPARDAYLERIGRLPAEREQRVDPERLPRRGVRSQRELAARHGVTLVYVVQPGDEAETQQLQLHEEGESERLLDYNRPDRYPDLFALENRYDEKHLNQRGAEAFTRTLAADLARLLGAGEL